MMDKILGLIIAMHMRIYDRERGATATEYALLVAFIALAIIVGVTAFGNQLNTFFDGLAAKVTK